MWSLLAKNLLGVSEELQILYTNDLPHSEKNTSKWLLSPGPPSWWKWNLEYMNICLQSWWTQISALAVFENMINSSPKAFAFKSRGVITSQSFLMKMSNNSYCSVLIQLVLQIYVKKVKLHPNCNPNIFSEIIELQENGGSGGIQAQIPNCTVYIGIAA